MCVVIVSVFIGVVKVALTYPWSLVAHSMVSKKRIVYRILKVIMESRWCQ